MIVRAKLNNYRMSARKTRLVVNLVRGKKVEEALVTLRFVNKKVTEAISSLINSAIANAKNTYNLNSKDLIIKEIFVDEAVTYKRWMPRAMGRATPIRKRGCNITIGLATEEEKKDEKKEVKKVVKKVVKKTVEKKEAKKVVKKAVKKAVKKVVKKTAPDKAVKTDNK
jgi:large subunit ribosomal protein L22